MPVKNVESSGSMRPCCGQKPQLSLILQAEGRLVGGILASLPLQLRNQTFKLYNPYNMAKTKKLKLGELRKDITSDSLCHGGKHGIPWLQATLSTSA